MSTLRRRNAHSNSLPESSQWLLHESSQSVAASTNNLCNNNYNSISNNNRSLSKPIQHNPESITKLWDEFLFSIRKIWYFLLPNSLTPNTQAQVPDVIFPPELKQKIENFKIFVITKSFDSSNNEHEGLLSLYWKTCCPSEELTNRKTEQWKKLGFQGIDPASDFRGAGVFGLRCLLYFAKNYSETFQFMLDEVVNHNANTESYPFSIAGLNIVMMIFEFLGWGFKKLPLSTKTKKNLVSLLFDHDESDPVPLPKSEKRSSPTSSSPSKREKVIEMAPIMDLLSDGPPQTFTQVSHGFELLQFVTPNADFSSDFNFFQENSAQQEYDECVEDVEEEQEPNLFAFTSPKTEKIFYELFCCFFFMLHKEWYSTPNVSYMQFPSVLQATSVKCQKLIESEFTDFESLLSYNRIIMD